MVVMHILFYIYSSNPSDQYCGTKRKIFTKNLGCLNYVSDNKRITPRIYSLNVPQ